MNSTRNISVLLSFSLSKNKIVMSQSNFSGSLTWLVAFYNVQCPQFSGQSHQLLLHLGKPLGRSQSNERNFEPSKALIDSFLFDPSFLQAFLLRGTLMFLSFLFRHIGINLCVQKMSLARPREEMWLSCKLQI